MKEEICFKHSKRLGHTRAYVVFDWMANLAIDAAGGKSKVFGSKPGVAEYTPTDLGAEANRATKANIANYDDILALLERINPGYGERLRQAGKNNLSLLRGEIPEDVQREVQRSAAFRALSGGFGGSGMSKALTARDLGRTSLDLMDRGTNSAQQWEALAQRTTAPYMITAPDQAAMTFKNNIYKQGTEQFKYNVLAAPDPGSAGLFNTINQIGSTAASFGLSSMGGGGGGGGRGGGNAATVEQPNWFGATNASTAANAGTAAGAGTAYNWGWGG